MMMVMTETIHVIGICVTNILLVVVYFYGFAMLDDILRSISDHTSDKDNVMNSISVLLTRFNSRGPNLTNGHGNWQLLV